MAGRKRAGRRWEPWEDNIDDASMHKLKDGSWEISWKVCLPDGRVQTKHTRTREPSPRLKAPRAGQKASPAFSGYQAGLRARAHDTVARLREAWEAEEAERQAKQGAGDSGRQRWSLDDSAAEYVGCCETRERPLTERALRRARERAMRAALDAGATEREARRAAKAVPTTETIRVRDDHGSLVWHGTSFRAMMGDHDIRDSSRARYVNWLTIVHDHLAADPDAGRAVDRTLGWLTHPRNVRALLEEVDREHGTSTAKHVRGMLNKYVFSEMEMDELIDRSPLTPDMRVSYSHANHGTSRKASAKREGELAAREVVAVPAASRRRVVEWLLADPCRAKAGQRGGVTREQSAWRRRELVDLTLLQATTGLRLHECLTLTVGHVTHDADGYAVVEVTDENSKTGHGRKVGMFDPRFALAVSRRLLERCEGLPDGAPVFGAVKDHTRPWAEDNAHDNLRRLYDEIAVACRVPELERVSSHVWRASLNGEYADLYARGLSAMDEATRTALFGHTAAVERGYYTRDLDPEQQRARASRPVVVEGGRFGSDSMSRSTRRAG